MYYWIYILWTLSYFLRALFWVQIPVLWNKKLFTDIFPEDICVYDNISTSFGINADNSLNLEYKGQQLPDDCSFLTIKGSYKGIHDKRVLCVEPLVFVDPNCAVSITFTMLSSQQLVIPYDGVIICLSKSTLDLKDGTSTLMIHIKYFLLKKHWGRWQIILVRSYMFEFIDNIAFGYISHHN